LSARVVHRIEEALGCSFAKDTFKYSRLISHVHYMLLRIQRGEAVSIDINDYVAKNFPRASAIAQDVCVFIADEMKKTVSKEELTLLALHIQRVL
jgi:transcriptional antiterminator